MDNLNNSLETEPSPTLDKSNSKKMVIIFAGLILVILVAVGVLIFFSFRGQNKKTNVATTGNTQNQTQQEQFKSQQSIMLGQSKIKFPPITQAAVVSSSTLPTDILSLIHAGASNLKVEKITYGPQGAGYRISYQLEASNMQALYFSFDSANLRNNYQVVLGSRNLYFSLIEIKDSSYQARITLSMPQNNSALVQIIVSPI